MIAPEGPCHAELSVPPDVLLALWELFSTHPSRVNCEPEELRYLLSRYLLRRPEGCEVEVALGVLRTDGQVVL
jgi:hypothetical protein